jgi:hypothetical protein
MHSWAIGLRQYLKLGAWFEWMHGFFFMKNDCPLITSGKQPLMCEFGGNNVGKQCLKKKVAQFMD